MPLAVEALLPFVVLTIGAAALQVGRLRRHGGLVAVTATAAAAAAAATLLVRLAPAERVDFPYVGTFPFMDLAIRLDALSLVFGLTLLLTACLLMLARRPGGDDRRQPWGNWLLTTAAALAVVFAANMLLVYAFLQVLTLSWSGALDESAPRGRGLRLSEQVADLGLLVAAGLTAASVGTTSWSGLPSDAFGGAVFLLVLGPFAVRVLGLGLLAERPRTPVIFEPAIARAAVAGYLLLRLISVTGGRPPGRPLQVLLFGVALSAAAIFAAMALRAGNDGVALLRLVPAQAAIATALSALGTPLGTVAGVWGWLGVIALTGLATIRQDRSSLAGALTWVALAVLPPGCLFLSLWLGTQTLLDQQLGAGLIPLWLCALGVAAAVLSRVRRPERIRLSVSAAWGAGLLALAAVPAPVLAFMVLPAARIVRAIPAGTVESSPLGVTTGETFLPLLPIAVVAAVAVALWWRFGSPSAESSPRLRLLDSFAFRIPAFAVDASRLDRVPWVRLGWVAYGVVVALAITVH